MPRITTFYLSAQEKMLERAKRTFESNFDGEIEFIDFCIDEPVISQGAIDTAKTSDAVWYFAPHFTSANAPLSVIRKSLSLLQACKPWEMRVTESALSAMRAASPKARFHRVTHSDDKRKI